MPESHQRSGLQEHVLHGEAEYYLLERMADPQEPVRLVGREDGEPALFDGVNKTRFVVETKRGVRFLVEPWQLSRVPPDEMYRRLREQTLATKILVMTVRLAG